MGRTKASEADPLGRAKRGRPSKQKKKEEEAPRTGFEGGANPPWRKTVSIFKQPVTLVVTSSRETKKATPEQLKRPTTNKSQEKPYPVLWAKALEGLEAVLPLQMGDKFDSETASYVSESLHLASALTRACQSLSEHATAATVCASVHHPHQIGAFGQKADQKSLEENVLLSCNPEQPMIQSVTISNEEIAKQEKRVLDSRKRLQEVLKHFG